MNRFVKTKQQVGIESPIGVEFDLDCDDATAISLFGTLVKACVEWFVNVRVQAGQRIFWRVQVDDKIAACSVHAQWSGSMGKPS